jgi:hypothetical protein
MNKVHLYVSSEIFLVGIIVQHILLSMILHITIPSLYDCQSAWGVNDCDFRIFFRASYHVLNNYVGHVVSNYTVAKKEKGNWCNLLRYCVRIFHGDWGS